MKCLKCNSDIAENQLNCPGCGTSIEELKQNNLLMVEEEQANDDVIEVIDEQPEENAATVSEPVSEPEEEVINVETTEQNATPIQAQSFTADNKNKSNKLLLLLIILLVVVLIGGLGLGYFISKSPKSIFTRSINKLYKNFSSNLKEDADTVTSNFSLKLNLDGTEDSKAIMNIINNISLEGKVSIDYLNKLILVTLNSTYDNDKLINADIQYQKGNAYVLLNDIFDKYIVIGDMDELDNYFEKMQINKDHKIVIAEVKKALIKSLKSEYFESEKTELEINNVKENVVKNNLKITKDNVAQIKKDFLTNLKNDDKFLESYAKLNDSDKDSVKESIQTSIDYATETDIEDDTLELNLYTKGFTNELVKVELLVKNGDESTEISIIKNDDKNYKLKVVSADKEEVNININVEKEKDNTTLKISTAVEGQQMSLEIKYSGEYNKEVSAQDVSNSISIDELTEEQASEIMTKLLQNNGVKKLMEAINSIKSEIDDDFGVVFGNDSSDYTDYDSDDYSDFNYDFSDEDTDYNF